MKVIVTVQDPSNVHFFRPIVAELQERGHEVEVLARENDITTELLDRYGLEYTLLVSRDPTMAELPFVQALYELGVLRCARQFDPDVLVGMAEPAVAHVATLLGATGVVFNDTEHATLVNRLAYPFADYVYTPDCYEESAGKGHRRYPGYHELAYLHPDRFEPDPSVFDGRDVSKDDPFVLVRALAWESHHDVGQGGFADLPSVVARLEDAGVRVFVSSETDPPASLASYQSPFAVDEMHDVLNYADLYIGEGATMAEEAATLGTPAVYVSSLGAGILDELAEYGLLVHHDGPDRQSRALDTATRILAEDDPAKWERQRQRLLADTVDVTSYVCEQLEAVAGVESADPQLQVAEG